MRSKQITQILKFTSVTESHIFYPSQHSSPCFLVSTTPCPCDGCPDSTTAKSPSHTPLTAGLKRIPNPQTRCVVHPHTDCTAGESNPYRVSHLLIVVSLCASQKDYGEAERGSFGGKKRLEPLQVGPCAARSHNCPAAALV